MSRVRLPSPAPLSFGDFKADVAQLVERILGKDEVTSSNLVIGSRNLLYLKSKPDGL
jgi:hypothetical protein